jgi:hypothetical protein
MFEKKKIKEISRQKLQRGIPREVIREELLAEFPDSKTIDSILKYLPRREAREKFGKFNSFLLLSFVVFFLIDIVFLDFYSFPLILIDLLLIGIIGSYQLKWYPLILFRAFGNMGMILLFWLGFSLKNSPSFYAVMSIISLVAFAYGWILARKLAN